MKKRILSALLALALCLSLLPTGAFAVGSIMSYINKNGVQTILPDNEQTVTQVTEFKDDGFYSYSSQDFSGTVSVGSNVSFVLMDNCNPVTLNLTGTGESSSLDIYAGVTNSGSVLGTGTCSIASISGVTVTLYGGTYTSLPASGWALGENFCFRTGAEGNYTYSTTFTEGATVVYCPADWHSYAETYTDGKCLNCGHVCNHHSPDETRPIDENGQCDYCHWQYPVRYDSVYGVGDYSWDNELGATLSGTTATLFADVDGVTLGQRNAGYTIDLNGHTLTQVSQNYVNDDATIKDSVGGGKIEGLFKITGGSVKLHAGVTLADGIQTTVTGATLLDYLADGTAYADANGAVVDGSGTALTSTVKIVAHSEHSYTGGECACGYTLPGTGNEAEVSHTVDGTTTTTGYATFKAALDAASAGDTIKLLADDVKFTSTNAYNPEITKSITLDLNGKKLTGQFIDPYSGNTVKGSVMVSDNAEVTVKGNGTIGGDGLRIESGTLTLDGVTVDKVWTFGGKLIVRNAEIRETLYAGYSNYPTVTVEISGGTIQNMEVYPNAEVKLSGGTFTAIARKDKSGDYSFTQTHSGLLIDTYAYQLTADGDFGNTGAFIERSDIGSDSISLENVKVVKCASHSISSINGLCIYCFSNCTGHDWSNGDGKCKNCGYQLPVYAENTSSGAKEYFASLHDGLSKKNGYNKFTLLADCDETAKSYSGRTAALDLNGHELTKIEMLGGDSSLTVTDSVGTGYIDTLYLEGSGTLYGGSYGTIKICENYLCGVLADGYAYQSTQTNALLKYSELEVSTYSNVKVVKCTSHSYSDGACQYCGYTCDHSSYNNTTGKCTECGYQYPVKVTNTAGYVKWYASFDTAVSNEKACTITLMADVTGSNNWTISATGFTLDLNGHQFERPISVTGKNVTQGALIIEDSGTGGTVSSITVSIGAVGIGSGTVSSLVANSGAVNIVGGTVTSFQWYDDCDVEVAGGSFGTITAPSIETVKDMLEAGYAFRYTADAGDVAGEMVVLPSLSRKYLNNVEVVECTSHSYSYSDGACKYCGFTCAHAGMNDSYYCSDCKTQFKVYATDSSGENGTYVTSIDAAMRTDYSIFKLLADIDATASFDARSCSIDLNGHTLAGLDASYLSTECSLSITDSVGTGSIGTLNGANRLTLPDGYALQHTGSDTSMVKRSEFSSTLTNVRIVKCTSHDEVTSDGKCEYCLSPARISVTTGTGESAVTSYYLDFKTAMNEAASGATLKLLDNIVWSDSSDDSFENGKGITFDLNGHSFGQSSATITIKSGSFTVAGSGSFDARLYGYPNSSITLKDSVVFNGSVYLQGTSSVQDNVQFTSSNGLTLSNTKTNSVSISGGTFSKISISQHGTNGTLGDIKLPTGYGFKTTSGNTWYDTSSLAGKTSISNVAMQELPVRSVTLVEQPDYKKDSYSYGENIWLTEKYVYSGTGQNEWRHWIDGESNSSGSTSEATKEGGFGISGLSVGTHTVKVEAQKDGYSMFSEELTLIVTKGTMTTRDYATPQGQTGLEYTGEPQELLNRNTFGFYSETVYYGGVKFKFRLGTDGTWGNTIPTATDAGTYTVYWYLDGGDNYNDVGSETSPAGSVNVTIARKTVSQPSIVFGNNNQTSYTYTGSEIKPAFTLYDGDTVIPASEYTVSYDDNTDACNYATVTITCTNGGNYNFVAVTRTFEITRAAAPTLTAAESEIIYTLTPYTVDLSAVITGMPTDAGTVSYSLPITSDEDFSINGNELKIDLTGAAGASCAVPVIVSSTNYADATVIVTIKLVAKAQKNLAVTMTGWTYGGTANEPSYTKPDGAGDVTVMYKVKGADDSTYTTTVPSNAGEHTVKVSCETATERYTGTADFTIARRDITDAVIGLSGVGGAYLTYDGNEKSRTVTSVMLGDQMLTSYDYTVSGDLSGTYAQDYTITVTGRGNYTGTAKTTWTIGKRTLYANPVVAEKEYDGTTNASVTVRFDTPAASAALISGDSIEVTGLIGTFDNANIGTGKTVTIDSSQAIISGTNSGNYDVTFPHTATTGVIKARTVTATVTVADKEYDGTTTATVTAEVTSGLIEGDSIIITGLTGTFDDENVDTGKTVTIDSSQAVISGTNSGNYDVSFPATATGAIKAAKASVTAAPTANTLTYSGQPQALVTAGAANGGEMQYRLGENGAWSTTIPSAKNAGTYEVWYRVVGDSNHNDFVAETPISVTISPKSLTVTAKNHTITYGDAPANDGVTYDGFVDGEDAGVLSGTLEYAYSYAQFGNVGSSYTISPSGLSSTNYAIEFKSGTLTVNAKEIGLDWTNTSLTYNGSAQKPTATATGLVNGDSCEVTVSGEQTNAGENYTATAGSLSNHNYKLPTNGTTTFKIAPKSISGATVVLENGTFYYNGSAQTAQVKSVTLADGTVLKTGDYTVSGNVQTDVNDYTLRVSGTGNYTGTVENIVWKILSSEITNISAAQTGTLTYNGQPQTAQVSTGATAQGGQSVTFTYSAVQDGTYTEAVPAFTDAGEHTVWYKVNAPHHVEKSGSFKVTISPKSLTVTAKNHTITYGDAPANDGVSYSGFVSGEGATNLSGTLEYAYSYAQFGDVGNSYTITPSGLRSTNYAITFVPGTLTVSPKSIAEAVITLAPSSFVYDGSEKTQTVTSVTLEGFDSLTYDISGNVQTNAGAHVITATGTGNFTGTATTTFSIAKATPTGKPAYREIFDAFIRISKAELSTKGGTFSVPGTVEWVDENGEPLDVNTFVRSDTAYRWRFHPTDSTNYNDIFGEIVLWHYEEVTLPTPETKPEEKTEIVTVPVSSDHTSVEVRAEVTRGNATVEVSDAQIEKVAADGAGTVTLDISGLKNVESATVPAHVVEKTNEAEDTGLTVALPAGSVGLDETALESLTEAADGRDVDISVVSVPTSKLPSVVKNALGMASTVLAVVDVNVTIDGEKQSSFGGGKVTISIPYMPKKGEDTSRLTVWFVRDDGTIENKGGWYDAKNRYFVFETEHLSHYLLVNTGEAVSFTDVPVTAYYYDAVLWAAQNGITGGVGNDLFAPDASCTRAQIVTFLWRAAGCPEAETAGSFTDVPADAYYAEAVAWAVENGITGGVGGNRFAPEQTCTRAQTVAFLFRYAAANGMDAVTLQELVSGYSDAALVPDYALPAFNWALAGGVVNGSNGKLLPNGNCTRAQIVTMLYRLLGK